MLAVLAVVDLRADLEEGREVDGAVGPRGLAVEDRQVAVDVLVDDEGLVPVEEVEPPLGDGLPPRVRSREVRLVLAPQDAPLALVDLAVARLLAQDLDVFDALNEIRAIYGVPSWTRTPVLDALAATLHEDPSRDINTLGESVGYRTGAVHAWSCRLTSTYDCLDAMLWEPTFRMGLLGDTTEVGMYLKATTSGTTLMGVAASE